MLLGLDALNALGLTIFISCVLSVVWQDHRDDLQIESYEVLPYGLQQLFLTCAKQQAKLERARRGSLYISADKI